METSIVPEKMMFEVERQREIIILNLLYLQICRFVVLRYCVITAVRCHSIISGAQCEHNFFMLIPF